MVLRDEVGQDSCLPEDKNNGEFLICFSYLTGKKKKQLDFYVKNVLEKYYSACVVCCFFSHLKKGTLLNKLNLVMLLPFTTGNISCRSFALYYSRHFQSD